MSVLTLPNATGMALSVRAKALVFEDPLSRALLERLQRIAPSDATALIIGETGTGKEIVARHLHSLSSRRGRSFVAVNCAALAPTLIESEMFGHVLQYVRQRNEDDHLLPGLFDDLFHEL